MQPCKLAGMMLSMVYATSGCGVLGYDLKPSSVSGLTVEETTSPIGLFLTLKGLAMDSSYGPERFENVRMGNAMYISAYMKWRQRPDFDYQCFVPNDIERVFWGDVCIWDRAKYITIDGNINPCYAVRMAKDLFKWISGTNAITHVDEVKFLGYKSMESYEGHVNQHYFDRDRNEILPEACESRLGELLRCKLGSLFWVDNYIFAYIPQKISKTRESVGYVIAISDSDANSRSGHFEKDVEKLIFCLCIRPCDRDEMVIDLFDSTLNGKRIPTLIGLQKRNNELVSNEIEMSEVWAEPIVSD